MRRLAVLLMLPAAGLVACTSATPAAEPASATAPAEPASSRPAASGESAAPSTPSPAAPSPAPYSGPAFSAPTLDGGYLSDADVAGQPTVMWFWAPWCGVCQREAGQVAEAARALEGEVRVVGVAGFDEADAMREFVAQRGLASIPHLEDPAGRVWGAFGVIGQPTTVFMDAAGGLQVVPGVLSAEEIVDRARALSSG